MCIDSDDAMMCSIQITPDRIARYAVWLCTRAVKYVIIGIGGTLMTDTKTVKQPRQREKKLNYPDHRYSEAQITEALVTLALCKYDYKAAADKTGISAKQLQNWNESKRPKTVPEMLEYTIKQVLIRVPETFDSRDWGIVLGILLDKWMVLRGAVAEDGELLTEEMKLLAEGEKRDLIAEARRILTEATSSRTDH